MKKPDSKNCQFKFPKVRHFPYGPALIDLHNVTMVTTVPALIMICLRGIRPRASDLRIMRLNMGRKC